MNNDGSWKSDLLHVGILAGLCLLIGIYLIRGTVLISRDGAFYVSQAQRLAPDSAGVAQRYPAGYPFVLWAAHRAAILVAGHDSTMLWVHSAQGVTLVCRVLALVPLYFLGKLLVGARNSFWALLILIVLPYPAQYGSDVLREWPHLLFLSLGFWLLYWGLRRRQWWGFALVGLDAGLGCLIRPECGQLVLYAFLGLAFVRRGEGVPPLRREAILASLCQAILRFSRSKHEGKMPSPRGGRTLSGAGLFLVAGFLVPVVPYVYVTGAVTPHQLRASIFNTPPVISAIGSKAASDDPLEFEVPEGELLELPIKAADPDGDPLTFSLAGVPVGSRPVYEFRSPFTGSRCWTTDEYEKHLLLSTYSREVWDYEGVACYAYGQADARAGLRGVYRFWSGDRQRHFYTMDEREKEAILKGPAQAAWAFEGVVFYAFAEDSHPPDAAPVYRFGNQEHGYSWAVGSGVRGQGSGIGDQGSGGSPRTSDTRHLTPDPQTGTVVWYVHLGGEPPAGAAIEGGVGTPNAKYRVWEPVFRWRPGPGQKGDYQVNIIVSDGELQTCQLVKIRVAAIGNRRTEGRGQAEAVGCAPHTISDHMGQLVVCGAHPTGFREAFSVLRPEHAGLEKLPGAIGKLFAAIAEDLMIVFLVPWLLGLYHRLRYQAERVERVLVSGIVVFSITLMLGRHVGFGAGEDRRYGLGLIALTIFYIPVGLEIMARWLTQRKLPILPRLPWFHILVAIGIMVCTPKLLASGRADKTGYRAAAEWLRQNTKMDAVLAVPDNRISFYAERRGLAYAQYPDWRRADHVVIIGNEREIQVPEGWSKEYSVAVSRKNKGTLIIYGPAKAVSKS
jgi:hypothetical protein